MHRDYSTAAKKNMIMFSSWCYSLFITGKDSHLKGTVQCPYTGFRYRPAMGLNNLWSQQFLKRNQGFSLMMLFPVLSSADLKYLTLTEYSIWHCLCLLQSPPPTVYGFFSRDIFCVVFNYTYINIQTSSDEVNIENILHQVCFFKLPKA